jgi:hypothetical protein
MWLKRIRQPDIDDPWFHDGIAIADVNLKNAFHSGEGDHDPAADQNAAARQAGPGPTGQKTDIELGTGFHDPHDLLSRRGEDDDIRLGFGDGEPIAFIGRHVRGRGEHIIGTHDRLHPRN